MIPPEQSLPKRGTTRFPSNAGPENTATKIYLPNPGTTCSPMCPHSTDRPDNAATHQYLPNPGTMCLPTFPLSNAGTAYGATQKSLPKIQKYFPKTGTTCLPTCPPRNTGPDNAATPKRLSNPGPIWLPSSATLATANAKIPQQWLDYTMEVIGQTETVEARKNSRRKYWDTRQQNL